MQKRLTILALIFCVTVELCGQSAAGPASPQVSEETKTAWQMRYDSARSKKLSGWMYVAASAIPLAIGGFDYARRFDSVAVPGASYDVISCSGGVCINTVVREASTISRVENPGRRNVAIAFFVGGAACSIWGITRVQGGAHDMRKLEEQRRKWGTVSFAPIPAGRGWLLSYERTF
jgi:hypothetical protein